MLAIACHELDETEEARRWLRKTEIWLQAFAKLSPTELADVMVPSHNYLIDWLLSCLFYREAKALIDGPEAAAEALAVVTRGTSAAPAVDVDRLRETFLTKAVESAAKDALPLIQRGRWYAERGEQDKADADFTQAAVLTPNELNRFLEAGWWVVGPYPASLDDFCPPELDPDPSQPVRVMDSQTGLSDQPVKWRSLPSGTLGAVDLANLPAGSAYALAYVYSPVERSVLLRVEGAKQLRLWCNGEPVFKKDAPFGRYLNGARVPINLRAGRNVILAKAPVATSFTVRVGDTPLDRALGFAERRLWQEASELYATDVRLPLQSNAAALCEFAKLALLMGDDELYRAQCVEAYQRFRNGDRWARFNVSHLASFAPNPVLEAHYDEVVELALSLLDPAASPPNVDSQGRALLSAAWAALQSDHLPEAEQYLSELPALGWIQDLALSTRAILAEKRGNHAEAVEWLQKALASTTPALSASEISYWPHTVTKLLQVRAAERIVTGGTTEMDALIDAAHEQARSLWESADPLTAAFDHHVLTASRGGGAALAQRSGGSSPRSTVGRIGSLCRGRGRFQQGRRTRTERCGRSRGARRILRLSGAGKECGGLPRGTEPRPGRRGRAIRGTTTPLQFTIVQRDDVFAHVAELRGQNHALWMNRMIHQLRLGNAPAALADAQRAGNSISVAIL